MNKPIYAIVKIDAENIDGPSQELYDHLVAGSKAGSLRVDGMAFDVSIAQLTHGRFPS